MSLLPTGLTGNPSTSLRMITTTLLFHGISKEIALDRPMASREVPGIQEMDSQIKCSDDNSLSGRKFVKWDGNGDKWGYGNCKGGNFFRSVLYFPHKWTNTTSAQA
jgi:hypothetical protein